MNIKELARQAGFNDFPNDENGVWITDGYWNEELERFAELVAAAEREACAKLCEEKALYFQYDFIAPYDVADSCAEEIRARRDMSTKSQNVDTSAERVHESDKSVHDLRKVVEMALQALCSANPIGHALEDYAYHNKATEALRQALAQPEQEPVAWMVRDCIDGFIYPSPFENPAGTIKGESKPLYTAPPSKPWVSLTEEESSDIYNAHHNTYGECITSAHDLVLDIEAKLKEKNT